MFPTTIGSPAWDPFSEVRRMQDEINRLFTDFQGRTSATGAFPPTNIWVGEECAVVTAQLPGMSESDVELTVRDDLLTIRGKRDPDHDPEKASWHRQERAYGTFSRTVELPFRVDPENVQARFVNGVLEVELHRPAQDKPRRIQISAH